MGLHLINLVQRFVVAPEVHLDGAGVASLTQTSDEILARAGNAQLADVVRHLQCHVQFCNAFSRAVLATTDLHFQIRRNAFVVTYSKHPVQVAGYVNYRSKTNLFRHEIGVWVKVTLTVAVFSVKFIEVDIAGHAARGETLVIFPPINATHAVCVIRARHQRCSVCSPEVVDINFFVNDASKAVSTVGEFNFTDTLQTNKLECSELSAENIAHLHFILQSNNQVQPTWMESNCETLLGESV